MNKRLLIPLLSLTLCISGCHEHKWLDADCSTPMKCEICGKTTGKLGEHKWIEATYETPKTCEICGQTEGDPLPAAEYSEYFDNNNMEFILAQNDPDGQIQFAWSDKYLGKKTVSHYTLIFKMSNTLNYDAFDENTHSPTFKKEFDGPVPHGKYMQAAYHEGNPSEIFCPTIHFLVLNRIIFEFEDGTTDAVDILGQADMQPVSDVYETLKNIKK